MTLREATKLVRRLFREGGEDWERVKAFLDEHAPIQGSRSRAVREHEVAQLEKMLGLPPKGAR